jgi:hypothetical protein
MDRPQKVWLRRRPPINGSFPLTAVRLTVILTHIIDPTRFHRFDVPSDCSVELSPLGYQFFTDIFEVFDKVFIFSDTALLARLTTYYQDQDGALNNDELEDLFSTAPPGIPWRDQKFPGLDDGGPVTLQAWLARWRWVLWFTPLVECFLSRFEYDHPAGAPDYPHLPCLLGIS